MSFFFEIKYNTIECPNGCILFNDKEGWGFGLAPHFGATTYTAFLSYKLGIKTLLKGLK